MAEINNDTEAQISTPPSFSALGLAPELLRAVEESGYTQATPIQSQAIPLVLQGHDLMAAAQTGTGKTAAFTLPILQKLLPQASSSASPARHPVRVLILTPTRELAIQVEESVSTYAKYVPLRSTVVYGGVDIKTQTPHLRKGVEILVATPGRLLDHVEQRTVQLGQVQVLVLDEADRMLDMGFMPDLKRIVALLPKQRQNLLFSATFSDEIKRLADVFLTNPTLIEASSRNTAAETVTQRMYHVPQAQKHELLAHLIRSGNVPQVLVFTRTKIAAGKLARLLERGGISADAIHGDKSQLERMKALEAFKDGKLTVLVATDVAARGLDIDQLPLVVNYELPPNAEDYVHRIGRTGRAGASGAAISLVDEAEERYLKDIEKLLKREIPKEPLPAMLGASTPAKARPGADTSDRPSKPAGHRASKPRAAPADDWFSRPYEPNLNAPEPTQRQRPSSKIKKEIPALLGGLNRE